MENLPLELVNKIIMMSIPDYPYMWELKHTRVIVNDCKCPSCFSCSNFNCGCLNFEFNNKHIHDFGQILCLNWRDSYIDLHFLTGYNIN